MGRESEGADRVATQFGKRLRTERERRGWSQAELAKLLAGKGIPAHPTTIAKLEAAERHAKMRELVGLADIFGMSVDTLLGRRTASSNASRVRTAFTRDVLSAWNTLSDLHFQLDASFADIATVDRELAQYRKVVLRQVDRLSVALFSVMSTTNRPMPDQLVDQLDELADAKANRDREVKSEPIVFYDKAGTDDEA